jgi:DtxR family Mn-dependent transcriptional regulator
MTSSIVEDYLKTIYLLSDASSDAVATGKIAEEMQVSPGTVTSMLKTLAEAKLATYVPYQGASLTKSGKAQALRIVRRHRLIEEFLMKTLQIPWDQVHAEAERMEHAVSDSLIDHIDAYLGYPKVDPHGDPIPNAQGRVVSDQAKPLASCGAGDTFRLTRVLDQAPDFLRYLTDSGLRIGSQGRLTGKRPELGVLTIAIADQSITLSLGVAEKLLVARD